MNSIYAGDCSVKMKHMISGTRMLYIKILEDTCWINFYRLFDHFAYTKYVANIRYIAK